MCIRDRDDMPEVATYAGCAGSQCEVYVNGKEAVDKKPWIVDVNFQALAISSLVHEGENEILIRIKHGGWSGDPQLMVAESRLMGSFSLDQSGTRLLPPRTTIETGSWTEFGYPFYSGTGVYKQTAHIPEFLRGQRVILSVGKPADILEFVVNGASAGVRAWAPYEVDITNLVKPGQNSIEIKVTNSLANMLLSEPKGSGLLKGAVLTIY
jgi:hypothetical protein